MKLIKNATYPLHLCYSIALLDWQGKEHIVVAAEKNDPCYLFNLDGEYEQTIWEHPGGTMSLVPLSGKAGKFLASQKMYSPDDSLDSEIVLVSPDSDGRWKVQTIAQVSFAHRFGVLNAPDGRQYLVISMMKSAHHHEGDWSSPGKYIAALLPDELHAGTQLQWEVVLDGLLYNHGFCAMHDGDGDYTVISSQNGIHEIHPPKSREGRWDVRCLSTEPTSDMAFVDFDGDGKDEMITLSPFHGDTISIYHIQDDGTYRLEYEFPQKKGFVHSIFAGIVQGTPIAIIGHRKGTSRDLMGITYHDQAYHLEILDKDCGSTNVMYYRNREKDCLVSTNREIDEIAFYEIGL